MEKHLQNSNRLSRLTHNAAAHLRLLFMLLVFSAFSNDADACYGYDASACHFTVTRNGVTHLYIKVNIDAFYWGCKKGTWSFDVHKGGTILPTQTPPPLAGSSVDYILDCGTITGPVPMPLTVDITETHPSTGTTPMGSVPAMATCAPPTSHPYEYSGCWYQLDSSDGGKRYVRVEIDPVTYAYVMATPYSNPVYWLTVAGVTYRAPLEYWDGKYSYFDISSFPVVGNCYNAYNNSLVRFSDNSGNYSSISPVGFVDEMCKCDIADPMRCYANFSLKVGTRYVPSIPGMGPASLPMGVSYSTNFPGAVTARNFYVNIPGGIYGVSPDGKYGDAILPNGSAGTVCQVVSVPTGTAEESDDCTTCKSVCYNEYSPVPGSCNAKFNVSLETQSATTAILSFSPITPSSFGDSYTWTGATTPLTPYLGAASVPVPYGSYSVTRTLAVGDGGTCSQTIDICLEPVGAPSNPYLRKAKPAQTASVVPSELEVSVVPNPASDIATLNYSIPVNATVLVNIVDATGRIVFHAPAASLEAGQHKLAISTSQFASGIYLVKLKVGAQVITNRLSVTH